MFRSLTILRELVQSLANVRVLLKHSVKLCHHILCGNVSITDILPHLHIINNDIILLSVFTEI